MATMKQKRLVEVLPYDSNWPKLFELESQALKKALGDNCLTIYHIGSTSVPGLAAKPVIDMIPVVYEILKVAAANQSMQKLGYEAKGEYGMPFRRYFQKGGNHHTHHAHVFETGNPEIKRHLMFRDWLKLNPEDREIYAKLKQDLARQYPDDITSYCLGKDAFIANIDKKTGFKGLRVVKALTPQEWEATRHFRQFHFFDKVALSDPYTWTFDHNCHEHLVLYQGAEVIGYAHLQLWSDDRAAIRIIVIDEAKRNHHFGSKFLVLCEKWLKSRGYKSIHAESSPAALTFYRKNSYVDMPFNDPDAYEGDPKDIAVGKIL
jgi:GrpB-like predicted nucleotidyltransferase (UPF0157 family)